MEVGNAMEEERSREEHHVDQEILEEQKDDHILKGKNLLSLKKPANIRDSFDLEASRFTTNQGSSQVGDWKTVMKLAFQSIGVVYGDLGTSPLYVLPGIFPTGIKHNDDILGVLSLIFYSLMLITLIKYVFIVLAANDNGDGGTFALYSLLCRHAKASLTPNQQAEDKEVSNYRLDSPNRRLKRASFVKSMLENSQTIKFFILLMTMLGTSMVLGDGILTPCISVLSAVGGVKEAATGLTDNMIMWFSVGILIVLFQIQRFGTDKIGYSFAPILAIWFLFIGSIGLYNFCKYDPGVIKAINPMYIIQYFSRNKKDAWISLGGVILCLTGSEALFADLGHFSVRSIQISSCTLVFPCVVFAYFGQASYLRQHSQDASNAFYSSVPKPVYWPMFVIAVMAAIIASQSLISASFSIIQQSLALGCFPRVKVVHTSSKYKGQVYVPEINTILMLACVGVTLGFKNTLKIGNAYGIAVAFVFTITSAFLVLVMVMIWKTSMYLIVIYALSIWLLELLFLSSVLYKFIDGGYLPLLFAMVMMTIMYLWNYGYRKKYIYELDNKVSPVKLVEIASDASIHRIPGLALFYTELVQGISPIFTHYVANVPALHSVLVFISIKSLPICTVPLEDRFLFKRVEPRDLSIFRCIVRYGYKDARTEWESFKEMLAIQLKDFIRKDVFMSRLPHTTNMDSYESDDNEVSRLRTEEIAQREVEKVDEALNVGDIVHLMGENEVVASKGSSFLKKLVINYAYNWLRRSVRQVDEVFMIPRKRLLKVGMTYDV
ncbi:potassium transporter 5-like [Juglans microcarpa x Juglans regia]|uniref:potassium transporter 5-like n=1 Tax=Juglans microcarpa x Juglans regia TaxID=2249226 RepID=UPI001B7F2CCF|nr:potassium transporter 5-like [Juglans microcarpa x Juglans regia]